MAKVLFILLDNKIFRNSLGCLTCWCPCVTFGRIAEIVDRGSTRKFIKYILYFYHVDLLILLLLLRTCLRKRINEMSIYLCARTHACSLWSEWNSLQFDDVLDGLLVFVLVLL